jgi:spore maturation protein CgeB
MRERIQNRESAESPQSQGPQGKIIYVGNFLPAYSSENDIKKSFEALGWEVTTIQENQLTDEAVNWIIAAQEYYDFILYTRTWAEVGKQWRKVLAVKKVPIVSVHLDLYLGLLRGEDLQNDPFFQSDYVFSADGGHQDEFKQLGINHFFFPPAILHESCYLAEPEERFKHDVIFVGSYRYHCEWPYRPALINWLRSTYGLRFRLYPDGGHAIRGEELNRLYNSAKVIVGDSTYSPNYWSDRIPETLGRGGFLIHPRVSGLEKQFEYYKHLIPYSHGDFKGLKEIIDHYVQADSERDEIRYNALKHVKANHTYINRVHMIINKLKTDGRI